MQDVHARIGVSSRAAAALYALEHELLAGMGRSTDARRRDPRDPPAMDPKTVVRRFVEEYQDRGDERVVAELIHPDFVDHSRPPGVAAGAEGVRQQFDAFRAAFDPFRAEILDLVAEGDKVVSRKVFRGTHSGPFQGMEPTGAEVEIHVIDIVRVKDGRIVEHWNCVDRLGLLVQLGALSVPARRGRARRRAHPTAPAGATTLASHSTPGGTCAGSMWCPASDSW